jgi:hypothetical protein
MMRHKGMDYPPQCCMQSDLGYIVRSGSNGHKFRNPTPIWYSKYAMSVLAYPEVTYLLDMDMPVE